MGASVGDPPMICPFCSHDKTRVLETRETAPDVTRRRRECQDCGERFTTYERVELTNVMVEKKSGEREAFDRRKLIESISIACQKRPVTKRRIEEVVNSIEAEIREDNYTTIPSRKIGELVMDRLRDEDRVAYVRFASVYKEFEDVENFENVLQTLKR
jgi:transcriptional repressor NrdR